MSRSNVYRGGRQARVNYACAFVLSGRLSTRAFDACLEMGDGDEVAAWIYQRALGDPDLMRAAPRYFNMDLLRRAYESEFVVPARAQMLLDLR